MRSTSAGSGRRPGVPGGASSPQIPHILGQTRCSMDRIAVVSCHVERPLDDGCWAAFSEIQARRPGGFEIAALMRPPAAGESESLWLARARIAATRGPLGHHTHWGGITQARPTEGDPAALVREQAAWMRERGI